MLPIFFGFFNIAFLRTFISTAKNNDQSLFCLAKIEAVSRAKVYSELVKASYPFNSLTIAKIAKTKSIDTNLCADN